MEKCDGCNLRKNGRWYCDNCHEELLGELERRVARYKQALELIAKGTVDGDVGAGSLAVVAQVALRE